MGQGRGRSLNVVGTEILKPENSVNIQFSIVITQFVWMFKIFIFSNEVCI